MLRRPPPLTPGSPVAVVAPASPPRDPASYANGLSRLRDAYDVRTAWEAGRERGYLAASDDERAAALHEAIADPDIVAIFCVRGGYGSLRLLQDLDWTLARNNPTLLVGYSDVTALQLALYRQARWTSVSGPVVTEWGKMDKLMRTSFEQLVQGKQTDLLGGFDPTLRTIVPGTASGPLLGGNLAVLSRLLGTPFAPDFSEAILVLEEVGEAPYRVDRMLAHLEHAGVLEAVAGILLGHFSTRVLDADKPSLPLKTVFEDYLADRPYPVVTGLPYGHLMPRMSLPIGVPIRIEANQDSVSFQVGVSPVAN